MQMDSKKIPKMQIFIVVLFLVFLSMTQVTFAWYNEKRSQQLDISGGLITVGSYFAGGDGSKDKPFQIETADQLYNLAWLQYLGIFNQTTTDENKNESIQQIYFELTADIDASEYILPPIGTKEYPFVGNFNGNGKTISNLTVANTILDEGIQNYPKLVTEDTFNTGNVEIVGLFGVVGALQTSESTLTYDNSINEIKDLYIQGCTVSSQSENTLIGIAAGYVNGTLENVQVSDSSIQVAKGVEAVDSEKLTGNLSDYSLVGYCTDDYKNTVDVVTVDTPVVQTATYPKTETGNDWGGSIAMSDLYSRLDYFYKNATELTVQVTQKKEAAFKNYTQTSLEGSYGFGRDGNLSSGAVDGNSFDTFDLYGEDTNEYHWSYYLISVTLNGVTTYLNMDSSGSLTYGTVMNNATKWSVFSGTTGGYYIYTTVNATSGQNVYYLYIDSNGTLKAIQNTKTTSTYKMEITAEVIADESTVTKSTAIIGKYNSGSNPSKYISYNITANSGTTIFDGWKVASSAPSMSSLTMEKFESESAEKIATNPTYLPLNTESNYDAASTNTGYIVGGSSYKDNLRFPYSTGDIRVAKYAQTSLKDVFGDGNATYPESGAMSVRTITSNGQYFIKDNYNSLKTSENVVLSSTLQKYDEARDSLHSILGSKNETKIYGLHFMDAQISSSRKTVAEKVSINGVTYDSYEMPSSSIDFQLKDKGYINFFAGTYYSTTNGKSVNNDSFFSLYRIIRDEENKISQILEILQIYKWNNNYVYRCKDEDSEESYYQTIYAEDGTVSFEPFTGTTEKLTPVFDTSWLTSPASLTLDAVYYFEIPVDAGEYALGSVNGKTGAYLMYLDISSNAQTIQNITVTERSVTNTYKTPKGVDFAVASTTSAETSDGNASATITLKAGTSGTTRYSCSETAIQVTGETDTIGSTYVKQGYQLSLKLSLNNSDNLLKPEPEDENRQWRTTVNEYNTETQKTVQTIFSFGTSDEEVQKAIIVPDDADDEEKKGYLSTKSDKISIKTPEKSDDIAIKEELLKYSYTQPVTMSNNEKTDVPVFNNSELTVTSDPSSASYVFTISSEASSFTIYAQAKRVPSDSDETLIPFAKMNDTDITSLSDIYQIGSVVSKDKTADSHTLVIKQPDGTSSASYTLLRSPATSTPPTSVGDTEDSEPDEESEEAEVEEAVESDTAVESDAESNVELDEPEEEEPDDHTSGDAWKPLEEEPDDTGELSEEAESPPPEETDESEET